VFKVATFGLDASVKMS